jgi:predicted Zn finger-like uncharacterized protein
VDRETAVSTALSVVGGGVVSWIVAAWYYRETLVEVPPWAKEFVASLPYRQPSKAELLELFQTALNVGDVETHPVFGHVACPECHAPFKEMDEKVYGDDRVSILSVQCPNCGWSDSREV